MQSAINGVVTAACQEQSNATTVREMALKCYCLNVKSQVAITECVELTHIGVHWMGESGAISVHHQVIMDHSSESE
eukprot:5331786-Amphidinium_carterae.1